MLYRREAIFKFWSLRTKVESLIKSSVVASWKRDGCYEVRAKDYWHQTTNTQALSSIVTQD